MRKEKIAFTLAETLLTMMIIGVIAGMTIPGLIKNTQSRETVSMLKKEYAAIANAYDLAVSINGPASIWGLRDEEGKTGAEKALEILTTHLNVEKICGSQTGCFPDTIYKHLNGTDTHNFDKATTYAKARLADGSIMFICIHSATCDKVVGSSEELKNVCGTIDVDINGNKGPNQYGVDEFPFWMTKTSVIPLGTEDTTDEVYGIQTCKTTSTGYGCPAWVLSRESLDYL